MKQFNMTMDHATKVTHDLLAANKYKKLVRRAMPTDKGFMYEVLGRDQEEMNRFVLAAMPIKE